MKINFDWSGILWSFAISFFAFTAGGIFATWIFEGKEPGADSPPEPDLFTLHQKLDTLISNQHTLYRAITNHDHYVREWTRPVEF